MKNIHVLPTEKPSRIYLIKSNNKLGITSNNPEFTENFGSGTQNQHICITSNEEIKEGDWVIDDENDILEVIEIERNQGLARCVNFTYVLDSCKKIILTTDKDLIKDGVQAIDDEFLEWFVKNPSCEEIETFKVWWSDDSYSYEIIIPKEDWLLNNPQCKQIESCSKSLSKKCICLKEKPKQETLEEAANKANGYNVYAKETKAPIFNEGFIAGAKWQQEQDKNKYSAEEQTDILEVGQILVNEETLEYGLLQHIKMCLECNNESQAIRLLEKYGFEKQEERYSEEEIMDMFHSLSMHLPLHYEFLVKEQFKK